MGCTHYWGRTGTIDQAQWDKALNLCRKVIKDNSSILGDGYGEKPVKKSDYTGDISINGLGDNSHETFYIESTASQVSDFQFCKTACKPYDVVVTACLAIIASEVNYGFKLSSDGDFSDWQEGIKLAQKYSKVNVDLLKQILQ